MKKKKFFNLKSREQLSGHIFLIPFYIGFLVFYLQPIIQSISFSFQNVVLNVGHYDTNFAGLANYKYVFFQDANFVTNLYDSFIELLWKLPVIMISSLFFAIILNQSFRGRLFVRAVFFLPVILASGLVIQIVSGDSVAGSVLSGSSVSAGEVSQSSALSTFLAESGLNTKLITAISTVTDSMFGTIWATGIQTIIFLAGLQGIPNSLYEASAIEGATAWENFWKITLPMLLPIVSVNVVYTVVDFFTSTTNPVMKQVINNNTLARFGWASGMAWSYFLIIALVLIVILFLINRITIISTGGK